MSGRRVGGRPPRIGLADIERAGREIGLDALTVQAVAARLDVTPTALYRHVDGKFGLETLVGESVLAELRITDDPDGDTAEHLLSFAAQLRDFVLSHPGLCAYLQVLFPRGRSGARLLEGEIAALVRRGYRPDAAAVVCSTVAVLAISMAAAEERRRAGTAAPGFERALAETRALIGEGGLLAEAHADMPAIEDETHFRLVITACLHGILATAPPGRSVAEITTTLSTPEER